MQKTKRTLVVCAYNEEQQLSRKPNVLNWGRRLLEKGAIQDFVVVNDHSTDRTAEVVKKSGVTLLENNALPSRGKVGAWLQGVKYCFESGAGVMVTLDADLISPVKNYHIEAMAKPVEGGKAIVAILPVDESFDENDGYRIKYSIQYSQVVSGSRAILTEALAFLKPFFEGKPIEDARGARFLNIALDLYGPEIALHDLFKTDQLRLPLYENVLGIRRSLVIRNLKMDRRPDLHAEQERKRRDVQHKYGVIIR